MSEIKDNMKEAIEATAATKYDFDYWSGLIVQVKHLFKCHGIEKNF